MTKAQEMLDLAAEYEAGLEKMISSGYEEFGPDVQRKHTLTIEALRLAAQSDAPSRSVEIGPITIATNDTGACFFPATADSSVSVPQEPNNEEMENYRMALAYISKQSSDPQSRELAETALNAFPADRVPQSPREAALEAAALEFVAKVDRGEARSKNSYAAFKTALAISRPDRKSEA